MMSFISQPPFTQEIQDKEDKSPVRMSFDKVHAFWLRWLNMNESIA